HLLEVINDILDISKIEAGKLELNEEQVSIKDIINKSVRLIKERAENAGLDITIDIEPGLPLLFADARLIKQNLINLLSNAIKFTPQGGHITVRAVVDDDGAITIGVSDTGIGIAAEDFGHVLAPFGQVDSSLSRKYEGTGLGLPLVKSFIELHGGTLMIDSTIGLGTTVTIRFPAERAVRSGTLSKAANQ
ncbi:MAG: ATP-binding protein, partial [Alphaproteobacteria bacterium]